MARCGAGLVENADESNHRVTNNTLYSLNLLYTISPQLVGFSFYDSHKYLTMLGLPFRSWIFYKTIENLVGEKGFRVIPKKVRYNALQEKIE